MAWQFSVTACFQKIIACEGLTMRGSYIYMVFHREETGIVMVPVDFNEA
jgi:hypothetical protein